jgi:fructose-bisphosphate aldolase class II
VRKINIDTDLRLAATAEFRRIAVTRPDEFDPRKFLKPSMDAMAGICRARFEAFGTAGQASKIAVIPMADMAKRYATGRLDSPTTTLAAA